MLLSEVQANLMFGNFRQGQRYKVDIHDPTVAGLIKAGYLKIIWKGRTDGTDSLDPDRAERLPGPGVARPLVLAAQEKGSGLDGADQLEPPEGDLLSA